MARTLKLFRFNRRYCRAIGIDPHKSNGGICLEIGWKNLVFFVCEAQLTAALIAFMLFEAKSMLEYGTTFFAIANVLEVVIFHTIFSWEIRNCLKFIKNCEQFIKMSK